MKSKERLKFFAEIQARQKNITWPDAFKNSRSVDVLFWRGFTNATRVQRIGVFVFGLALFTAGLSFLYMTLSIADWIAKVMVVLFSLFWIGIGSRGIYNAFRR